jgi:hypothetical protein
LRVLHVPTTASESGCSGAGAGNRPRQTALRRMSSSVKTST